MLRITDYSFLFQNMSGTNKGIGIVNPLKVSSLSSSSVQAQLKAAGINTNSKQYKAAIRQMTKDPKSAAMFTNVQAIKNMMSSYDSNGDWIDPDTGLTGLLVTDENRNSWKHTISIPESSKEEMFNLLKKEYLRENGVCNGDTTKRSDVYTNLYKKMNKDDRLSAGWTLQQYEREYRNAFYDAVKSVDSNWEIGKPIPHGALDNVTRDSVEKSNKSIDMRV